MRMRPWEKKNPQTYQLFFKINLFLFSLSSPFSLFPFPLPSLTATHIRELTRHHQSWRRPTYLAFFSVRSVLVTIGLVRGFSNSCTSNLSFQASIWRWQWSEARQAKAAFARPSWWSTDPLMLMGKGVGGRRRKKKFNNFYFSFLKILK